MKYLKIVIIIIAIVLTCGCGDRKCVRSHEELTLCTRVYPANDTVQIYTYPCTRTICDEYEEDVIEKEESNEN